MLRNFGPVFLSRGVVQISAFIDAMIASLLPVGAVAVISNAQTLYLLPVSLFGMSVAAAELPELSEEAGEADAAEAAARAPAEEFGEVGSGAGASDAPGGPKMIDPARAESLRRRISAGSDRIAYFIVPSGVVFMTLGRTAARRIVQEVLPTERCLVIGDARAAKAIERKFKMTPSVDESCSNAPRTRRSVNCRKSARKTAASSRPHA